MPRVENKKGKLVAEFAYNPEGKIAANKMVENNPGYNVTDARERSINSSVEEYEYGGRVGRFGGEEQPGGQYDPNAQLDNWTPGEWQDDTINDINNLVTGPKGNAEVPSLDSSPSAVKGGNLSLDSSPAPGRLPARKGKSFNPKPGMVPPGSVPRFKKGK